jgi:hypothetical protein
MPARMLALHGGHGEFLKKKNAAGLGMPCGVVIVNARWM